MSLRRSRSIEPHQTFCLVKGKYHPYGSVWMQIMTHFGRRDQLMRRMISDSRKAIEREIRKHGLTFVRWAQINRGHDCNSRQFIWHIAADVVYDDAYHALQPGCYKQPDPVSA